MPALTRVSPDGGLSFPLFRDPQSESPVKVMVTPQHRATFFTVDGAISDQIQTTLPVASGQALNEVIPAPGGPLVVGTAFTDATLNTSISFLEANPEMINSAMLVAMMSQMDAEKSNLTALNKILSKFDIPLAIEKRNK